LSDLTDGHEITLAATCAFALGAELAATPPATPYGAAALRWHLAIEKYAAFVPIHRAVEIDGRVVIVAGGRRALRGC
jgi:hypothetical protein